MSILIVNKPNKKTNDLGTVKPVYEVKEGKIEPIGNEDKRKERFPNNGAVIILKDFYRVFEEFHRDEFFKIESEKSSKFEESIPGSCLFQALNGNISSVERLPLLIKREFNIKDDIIILPYPNHKYVFINDGDYIYGPLSITQEYQEDVENEYDEYSYKIDVLNTEDLGIENDYIYIRCLNIIKTH